MRQVAVWIVWTTPLWAVAAALIAWMRTRRGSAPLPALVTATADVLLVASVVCVLLITMKGKGGDGGLNLSPLVDTWRDLSDDGFPRRGTAIVVGNALLLAPSAFLVAWRVPQLSRLWTLTLAGLLFSGTVEVVQLLFRPGRTFEVDDLILNTLSAALGAACWFLVRPWVPATLRRNGPQSRRPHRVVAPPQRTLR